MFKNEEKENYSPGFSNLRGSFEPMQKSAKPTDFNAKVRSGTFGKLLSTVNCEFKKFQVEQDEKCAAKSLIDDACMMTAEWIQESQDRQVAKAVNDKLDQEDRLRRQAESKDGESYALKVAMEERSRIRNLQQAKAELEEKDHSFARKVVLQDIDAQCEFKALCDNDSALAKEVYNSIQDELYAENLYNEEKLKEALYLAKLQDIHESDSKFAFEQHRLMEAEESKLRAAVEESDRLFAIAQQEHESKAALTEKQQIEEADALMARRIQVQGFRQEHRRLKRVEHMAMVHNRVLGGMITAATIEMIANQWANAEAKIEDVADGICITIILPYLNDLSVRAVGTATVEIEAKRVIFCDGSRKTDTPYNAEEFISYSADFVIDGSDVALSDASLSYEYVSDLGLLHVYVDSISLSKANKETKQNVLDTLKESFKRLFSK